MHYLFIVKYCKKNACSVYIFKNRYYVASYAFHNTFKVKCLVNGAKSTFSFIKSDKLESGHTLVWGPMH